MAVCGARAVFCINCDRKKMGYCPENDTYYCSTCEKTVTTKSFTSLGSTQSRVESLGVFVVPGSTTVERVTISEMEK